MASMGDSGQSPNGQGTGSGGDRGPGERARVRVWRWPVLLALLSLFGLLSALLGQGGVWWVLSWIALATPLIVITRCLWRRHTRPCVGSG